LSNQLDGYWSNCTSRLLEVDTCWPPLISAVEKSGPRPWMVSTCGRPLTVCTARPGRRPSVSAMLTPGSLPICSADTASTMLLALRLSAVEFSMLLMKPLTSTVCSCFAFFFDERRWFLSLSWLASVVALLVVSCGWLSCAAAAGAASGVAAWAGMKAHRPTEASAKASTLCLSITVVPSQRVLQVF